MLRLKNGEYVTEKVAYNSVTRTIFALLKTKSNDRYNVYIKPSSDDRAIKIVGSLKQSNSVFLQTNEQIKKSKLV